MISYANKERVKYCSLSSDLMAQYCDGSHTYENPNGDLYWYKNNLRHRDGDKPAVITANGYLEWWKNDQRHRSEDKPAFTGVDGTLLWYQNGERHRFGGPAMIKWDNVLEWFINDENITQEVRKWLNRKPWRGTPEQIVEFQLRFT